MYLVLIVSLLTMVSSSSFATVASDSPEVVALKEKASACLQTSSEDFLTTYLPDLELTFSTRTIATSAESNNYGVAAFVTGKNATTGCEVNFEAMQSNLTIGLNNKCGLGDKFLYFRLRHDGIYSCTPPLAYYSADLVNDGYDDLGREINPRMVYKSSFARKGGCLSQKKPVYFINYVTEKPTKMTFGLAKLWQCLSAATNDSI